MSVVVDDHSPEFLSAMEQAKKRGLWAIGATAEGYAKGIITNAHRVDTGRMRNSVTHAEDEDATYIGTNVDYAIFHELGTSRIRAIHFLTGAASQHKEEYRKILKDSLENA